MLLPRTVAQNDPKVKAIKALKKALHPGWFSSVKADTLEAAIEFAQNRGVAASLIAPAMSKLSELDPAAPRRLAAAAEEQAQVFPFGME